MQSNRQVFRVDREEIGYLRFTIESYNGMAVVSTVDPYAALIEVCISPGCEETVSELLTSLKHEEGLKIERVGSVRATILEPIFRTGEPYPHRSKGLTEGKELNTEISLKKLKQDRPSTH
jgi:hypothetical protein